MKKFLLLTAIALSLMIIAYAQVQQVMQKKMLVEASDEIVIRSGKSSITMKKDGSIIIRGTDIQIEGSDNIVVKGSGDVLLKGRKMKGN
ncbi:MAG: hypothetical protein EOO13_14480 [Chitinophagaceae bacterium]|nr:MAG: hypothetical protein EOO13_14480 [Chitinophagaceae bacterium]